MYTENPWLLMLYYEDVAHVLSSPASAPSGCLSSAHSPMLRLEASMTRCPFLGKPRRKAMLHYN
jgi:hypothetical protein